MKLCSLLYKYTYKNISRNLIMTNMENYNSIIEYNNANIDINSFTLHKTKSIIPLALLEELDEDEL